METFGLVILEAMAAGLPVVTTSAPGVRDLVADGVNAKVSRIGDLSAMVDNIDFLMCNGQSARRLKTNAQQGLERFSWSRVAAEYERAYAGIVVSGLETAP